MKTNKPQTLHVTLTVRRHPVKQFVREFIQFATIFIVGTIFLLLVWGLCEGLKDTCFPGFNSVPYVEGK